MDVVLTFKAVQGERSALRWSQPVSFEVRRGQVHLIRTSSALSGPLLRLCLGFSEPSAGEVIVSGRAPGQLAREEIRALRRSLGCVLEPEGLVANLTLRMNLVVPLVFATGLDLAAAGERVDAMLEALHLAMWSDVRPASLPAEVRQAAALGRALCPRPALALLENPLASVDNRETRRLLSLCRASAETMVIAAHRYDSVLHEFADVRWEWDDDGFRMAA